MSDIYKQLVDNSYKENVKWMIYRMYVDTADDNYVVARWSYINDLDGDFYWLSLHAIEKYLKAVLLLNGKSSRGFKHDLTKLYAEFLKLNPQICVPAFEYPPWIFEDISQDEESIESYLAKLNEYGSPDNRYASIGYDIGLESMHRVDHIIWHIRRYCCTLSDRVIFDNKPTKDTNLQHLIGDARATIYKGRLYEILKESPSERRSALMSFNYAFDRSASTPDHMRSAGTWGALRWVALGLKNKHDPVRAEASRRAIAWAKENLSIGKSDRNFIAEQERLANDNQGSNSK